LHDDLEVTDNGIGRKSSSRVGKKNKKSSQVTRERLETSGRLSQKSISSRSSTLCNDLAAGTKVV